MLNERQVKEIEWKLNDIAKDHESYTGSVFADTGRAYAQGIAFALSAIGYSIEWDNGKATVVKDD